MSTPVHVGKALLFPITLHNPDGSVNTTATPTVSSGNSATMVARLNPGNPREGGVRGVAAGSPVNVIVSAPVGPGDTNRQDTSLIDVQPAEVDLSDADIGAFGAEIDPPAWLL